jgi:hypothetical protein
MKLGTCIFCGRKADSVEDLFPKWIDRMLELPPDVGVQARNRYQGIPERSRVEARPRIVVRRRVCHKCNNRWMSRIQNDVQPLLANLIMGEPGRPLPAAREPLERWMTMTTMVMEWASKFKVKGYYTQAERDRFRESQEIPPVTTLFLARRFDTDAQLISFLSINGHLARTVGPDLLTVDSYILTVAIGKAVLQLLVYRIPPGRHDPRFWRGLHDWTVDWSRLAIRFGPQGLGSWPPADTMDEITLDAFGRRWGG